VALALPEFEERGAYFSGRHRAHWTALLSTPKMEG
jgi:hypothetical protein